MDAFGQLRYLRYRILLWAKAALTNQCSSMIDARRPPMQRAATRKTTRAPTL